MTTTGAWLRRPLVADVDHPISKRQALVEVGAVYLAFFGAGIYNAVLSLLGDLPTAKTTTWATAVPSAITALAEAGLAVALVVLLSLRRHRDAAQLGLSPTRTASPSFPGRTRRRSWVTAVILAATGQTLFAIVAAALGTGMYHSSKPGGANLFKQVALSINAGFVEESVVLAFVVVTLAQSHYPLWKIAAWAIGLRLLFHLYYGPGALGVVLWVPLAMLVFWAGRSVFALIVVHVVFDVSGFFATWPRHSLLWKIGFDVRGLFLLSLAGTIVLLWQHPEDRGEPPEKPRAEPTPTQDP